MCRPAIFEFFLENSQREDFQGKRVIEVGSKYVNGTIRPFVERHMSPHEYIGVDIEPGKYVDQVVQADKLVERYGQEAFDVVISTETVEHIADWRTAIQNMKSVLAPGGLLFLTTVRIGFPCHGYPHDFWRYEKDDMEKIFSDFEIRALDCDREYGISLKVRKPAAWRPANLEPISLYSVPQGRRETTAPSIEGMSLNRRVTLRFLASKAKWALPIFLLIVLERRYSGAGFKELYYNVEEYLGRSG